MKSTAAAILLTILSCAAGIKVDPKSDPPKWVVDAFSDQTYSVMKQNHADDLDPRSLPDLERKFPIQISFVEKKETMVTASLTDRSLTGLSRVERKDDATMRQDPHEQKHYMLTIPSHATNLTFTTKAQFEAIGLKFGFDVQGKMDEIRFTSHLYTDGDQDTIFLFLSMEDIVGLDFGMSMVSPESCPFIDKIVDKIIDHSKPHMMAAVRDIIIQDFHNVFDELFRK